MKDQSNKADGGKLRMGLLFRHINYPLAQVAAILSYGAEKYEDNGWKKVDPERYWDALYRHLDDWHSGEVRDPESGLHHLAHAACNILFLLWFATNSSKEKFLVWNKPPQEHKKVNTE